MIWAMGKRGVYLSSLLLGVITRPWKSTFVCDYARQGFGSRDGGHGGCSYFEQSSATQLGDAKSMGGQIAILMVFPAGRLAARLPSVSGRVGDERCQVDRSPCCNASTAAMPSAQGFRGRKAEERLTD